MGEKERAKEECPEILGMEEEMADEVVILPTLEAGAEEEGHTEAEEECLGTTKEEDAMGGKATSAGMVPGAVAGRHPQCSFAQLSR